MARGATKRPSIGRRIKDLKNKESQLFSLFRRSDTPSGIQPAFVAGGGADPQFGQSEVNEFRDDLFKIFDDIDPGRKLRFQTGGVPVGTTIWTAQRASGTVALLDSGLTQIFSVPIDMNNNKIIRLGDPINDLDAVNLRTLNQKIAQIVSQFHDVIRIQEGISEVVTLPEPNVGVGTLFIAETVTISVTPI